MMYNEKLAVAVKSNGKVLREMKDTVYVPFGTEYSLLIKNLNSVRAQVRVSIDGTDATEGVCLVLDPNSEIDLERFIKNGNMNSGNRFKFIERTESIENHRGIKIEDGLIRIEYQFEQVPTLYPNYDHWYKSTQPSILRGIGQSYSGVTFATNNVTLNSPVANSVSQEVTMQNDAGITVPGAVSDQSFKISNWFPVESKKHVMIIKMLGETEAGKLVQKPVTVKAKPICTTCGKHNKATSKFCAACGTGLVLV